jgi:hypothetical protein
MADGVVELVERRTKQVEDVVVAEATSRARREIY